MLLMSNSPHAVATYNTFFSHKLESDMLEDKIREALKRDHILYRCNPADVTLNTPSTEKKCPNKEEPPLTAKILLSGSTGLVEQDSVSFKGKFIAVVDYDCLKLHRAMPLFEIISFVAIPTVRGQKYRVRFFETKYKGSCPID